MKAVLSVCLRVFAAFAAFLLFWVGLSQLGVVLLGPGNNAIILFGVVGAFLGVGSFLKILTYNRSLG